jgi:hypothetical protein
MSIEAQHQLYEEKYLGQQNIYGNQQQHLKRMNQKLQNSLCKEQIDREQHLNQGRHQQQYQQTTHFTQLPQATQLPQLMQSSQSARKEPERDHYLQHLQQARQQQARKQLPQSMQTFQASRQLTEDESHLEHLRLARQQRAHQSIQTFMSDPRKTEHEQHLYNMQLANQQHQYLVSPQQQMDHKIHLQQLQLAHEQQARQEHARRQLSRSSQTLHSAQQQMTHEQHLRYLRHQNQIRQQQQHQQVQVAPPIRVARLAGPAYGTPYPNQQLQTVPQGQAAYLTLPTAQQYQPAVSASLFHHGASHNLPIDRMQLISPAPSSKRSFEFVDKVVPESFVANPDNHGRWFVPDTKRKEKIYLNGPHSKKARLALEE